MCYISARKWRSEAFAVPSEDAVFILGHQESDASWSVCFLIYLSLFKPTFLILEKIKVIRSGKPSLTAVGIRCADHATPSIRRSWY
jgi:hypothetical protein